MMMFKFHGLLKTERAVAVGSSALLGISSWFGLNFQVMPLNGIPQAPR
jgi:hypothetical protein